MMNWIDKQHFVIWDWDTPLFRAAVMCQKVHIIAKHKKSGREKQYESRTEFNKDLETINKEKGTNFKKSDFKITDVPTYSRSYTLETAKWALGKAIANIKSKPFCGQFKMVIGGEDNYRYDVDPLYKSNRPEKPLAYQDLREWALMEFKEDVLISDGCEADDVVSIFLQWGQETGKRVIAVGIDKDANQCIGRHYNPDTDSYKEVDEDMALRSLWVQMLLGDTTDCIKGLPGAVPSIDKKYKLRGKFIDSKNGVRGVGKKNAEKIVNSHDNHQSVVTACLLAYKAYYDTFGSDIGWQAEAEKQYKLLGLMKHKGVIPDLWEDVAKLGIDKDKEVWDSLSN